MTIEEAEQATGRLINESSMIFPNKPHSSSGNSSSLSTSSADNFLTTAAISGIRTQADPAGPCSSETTLAPSFSDAYDVAWRSDPAWTDVGVLNGLVESTVTSWMWDMEEFEPPSPCWRQGGTTVSDEETAPVSEDEGVVCCITHSASKRPKKSIAIDDEMPSPSPFDSAFKSGRILTVDSMGKAAMVKAAFPTLHPAVRESSDLFEHERTAAAAGCCIT